MLPQAKTPTDRHNEIVKGKTYARARLFAALIEHGDERDHSALLTVLERLSNFSLADE